MKKISFILVITVLLTACKNSGSWTAAQKQDAVKQCMNAVTGVDNATATKYCSCFLDKLMQKYPNYADANKNGTEAQGQQLGQDCAAEIQGGGGNNDHGGNVNATGGWTKADEDKWMAACVTNPGDQELCKCVLQKIEKKYANYDEANRLGTREEGQQLGQECKNGQ